jgi:hypothetical protein
MRILVSIASLSCFCAAQVTSPAHFAEAEGPGSTTTPFGLLAGNDRYLQVHGDVNRPFTINRILFRRDHLAANVGSSVFNTTLRLSTAAAGVSPVGPSPVFALNHGAGLTAFTNLSVNMPPTSSQLLPGRPFDRVIPLPRAYQFAGGAALVWEVEFNSRAPTFGATFDLVASLGDTNPGCAVGTFGTGCRVRAGEAPLGLEAQTSIDWRITHAGRFLCTTSNALRDNSVANFVFLLVGLSRTDFAGIPLPFQLPATAGAPSGPCTLYTSIFQVFASAPVNLTTGTSSFQFQLPASPQFNGASLYFQSMALSPTANAYGSALSNAVAVQVIAPFGATPIGRVSGNGHGAAVTGTVSPVSGLVTRFE